MRLVVVLLILVLLFGLPWAELVAFGPDWPAPVFVVGTVVFAVALLGFPVLMYLGHRRGSTDRDGTSRGGADWAARIADSTLGAIWVLFTWTVLGELLRLVLALAGVANPERSRIVALAVLAVWLVLLGWGHLEAMRVPRTRRVDVTIPRLGKGFDGTTIVLITDTHLGPLNRARWSAKLVARVNALDADLVVHAGDLADGPVSRRRPQTAPLANVHSRLSKVYVTGNHEYFGEAQSWLDHMTELGWESLHNRHITVHRGGDRLVVAGIDDHTAAGSRTPGHGADLATALAGADPGDPILLVAHQPKQVTGAAAAGVDLQLSGHTHGGQIWPFRFLVLLDQPSVHGLSTHGERTQLYTSRGSGFWGPPLRVFAPSEITVLTLHTVPRQ